MPAASRCHCLHDHVFACVFHTDVVIGYEETEYSGSESDGEIEVVVAVLQGELSGPVVVRISTMDGTALSGSDYESVDMTITFDPDNTRILVTVPVLEDDIDEADEDILARLGLEPGDLDLSVLIQPDEAVLIIEDNDGMPLLCVLHSRDFGPSVKINILPSHRLPKGQFLLACSFKIIASGGGGGEGGGGGVAPS